MRSNESKRRNDLVWLSLQLPRRQLDAIDRAARRARLSRSAFVRIVCAHAAEHGTVRVEVGG